MIQFKIWVHDLEIERGKNIKTNQLERTGKLYNLNEIGDGKNLVTSCTNTDILKFRKIMYLEIANINYPV